VEINYNSTFWSLEYLILLDVYIGNMAVNMRRAVNAVTDFVFPIPKPTVEPQELYLLKAGS